MREETRIIGTVAVPTLDDLAREPAVASGLPSKVLAALQARIAAAQGALAAAMATAAEDRGAAGSQPDKPDSWLEDDQVTALLHVSRAWLVRHRNRLPFAKRLSRKRWLYSESGARRWLASRKSS
jgi:hypothetical protein